jgi:membrane-bound serine protease (ClpP class)
MVAESQPNEPWVAVIPVKGEINEGLAIFVQRAISDAEKQGASAILIDIETFGGRVDAAVRIRDSQFAASVPTLAYVQHRAWSAGALITIASRHIVLGPAASIGSAEPIPTTEKTVAALRGEFAATAQHAGRNAKIAEAMVDKTLGYPGLAERGQILSMTAEQAKTYGFADSIAPTRTEALRLLDLAEVKQIEYTQHWYETLAGWLAEPWVKSILAAVMMLAFMVEIKTAGLGIGALVGTIAAVLFFGGPAISGSAGWGAIGLFIIGIVLIAIELHVPGGLLFGMAGVAAIFGSLFLGLGGHALAAVSLLGAVILAGAMFVVLAKYLPTSKLWNKLVLKNAETSDQGFVSTEDFKSYLGQTGKVLTLLRPAGIAEIAGRRLDVVSEGTFVVPGTEIVVTKVEGNRIVVKEV